MNYLIEARGLSKTYLQGGVPLQALKQVDFQLSEGEMLAICGHSGSGKSTLLNVIGTLEIPDAAMPGSENETESELILWGNQVPYQRMKNGDLTAAAEARHQQLRQQGMGFVFQNFNLNPALTALENVSLPLMLTRDSSRTMREKATLRLQQVGLGDRLHHRPGELSGGQQQRVAVARALVTNPMLVLADEPTANLDNASTQQLVEVMQTLNREQGTGFLFSTHDERLTRAVGRQLWLDDGRVQPMPSPGIAPDRPKESDESGSGQQNRELLQ